MTKRFLTISLGGHVSEYDKKFRDVVDVDRRVFFIPSDADVIGVLGTYINRLSMISIGGHVSGGVVVVGRIFVAPFDADSVGVLFPLI